MRARKILLPVLLLGAALLSRGASAQTPVHPAQFIVPPNSQSRFLESIAMDGSGKVTFLWTTVNNAPTGLREEVYLRQFSSADGALGPAVRLESLSYSANAGTVVANQRGDVLVTWSRSPSLGTGPAEYFLRRTSPVLPTLKLPLSGADDVAVDRNGNFIVVWTVSTPGGHRIHGQRYNFDGTPRGPEFDAADSRTGDHVSPSVAMNPNTGEFVIVWELRDTDGSGLGVLGQRFGFTTGRKGSNFEIYFPAVIDRPSLIQPFGAQVARAANGSFVVIWRNPGSDGFGVDILGRRYRNTGAPVGGLLVIAENESIPDSRPQIAMAPNGEFVVTWDDQGTSPQWFRQFNANGTPAGPVISQPGLGGAPYYGTGRVAFGWNGTFVYGWTNYNDDGPHGNTISYQRFTAAP